MNAPHLRITNHSQSGYGSSIPDSLQHALDRRHLLDAGQRAFRQTAEGRVRPDPAEMGLPGRRFRTESR